MTRLTQLSCLLPLAAALGCGETTSNPPSQLTFDRPVDIAFACHGGLRITGGGAADPAQPIEISAMPTAACDVRSQPLQPVACRPTEQEPQVPLGQENLRDAACNPVSQVPPVSWYGLILQSGPGTVAIAQFTTKAATLSGSAGDDVKVLDADPLTPGKNSISVGEEPVAIHTDPAGCHAITANAGSCDLSVLDLNSAFDTDRSVRVDRLEVKNASGVPIRSRPAAMVGEPSEQLIGNACPAAPQGLIYVAYPSCHLVAAVDTSTGTIEGGIQFVGVMGTPTIVGGDVTCPDECGGGAVATDGVRPVALDFEIDPNTSSRRLAIGADNSARITVVELDSASLPDATSPTPITQIALEDPTDTLGVTALALSPEIGMGGKGDILDEDGPGGAFQFVYAVATDGTVRVADVLDEDRECDTQVDPRFARENQIVRDLSCLQPGTLLTPRRPGARSPGIHLPGDAIPLSVEFFVSALPIGDGRPTETPTTLLGHFAAITASNGATFVVNVDDDNFADLFNPNTPLAAPVPHVIAHQLRDLHGDRFLTIDDEDKPESDTDNRDCDYGGRFDDFNDAIGGPRAPAPTSTVPAGTLAAEKLGLLPGLRKIKCERLNSENKLQSKGITELQYAAPAEARDRSFPDLMALPEAETWNLIWEGPLSLNTGTTDTDGPAVREGMLRVDALGLHVLDLTRPFCEAGVEPFDILQLRGCDPSVGAADCPSGYTCFVHPDSEIQGLGTCMLADEADRLAGACRDFMTTVRRYTVRTATSGELVALPRRVELRTTPLDGCVSDQQCEDLGLYAEHLGGPKHPFQEGIPDAPATCGNPSTCETGETNANCPSDCGPHWACVADPLRAPKGGTGKRCELRCDTTADCLTGTVCQGAVAGQPRSGFCMEGVIPPQACINASQRYEVSAGEAFVVIGTESGYVHPIVADATGQCVRNPADRLSIGRIPLVPRDPLAPNTLRMCDPTSDPLTGQLGNGTFEPNPCLTTVPHTDERRRYGTDPEDPANVCNLEGTELVERQAPAVVFRNRSLNLTLVDPYYPGDRTCTGDRQGLVDRQGNPIPGQIPHLASRTTLTIRQLGGFAPLRVTAEDPASFPVKIVRGPTGSVWILDEGDFLSASPTQASTRGKVLRFHPNAIIGVNVLR